MENNYNDTEILINSYESRLNNSNNCNKYSSTIKLWLVISIALCVLSYTLLDINIIVYYESIDNNDLYKYIYIYDCVYAIWYLGMYIFIACNSNNKNYNKCVYFLISIIYLANFIFHIFSYVKITNELKKINIKMTNGIDNFVFYCLSVIFNWIMTFWYFVVNSQSE